MARGGSFRTHFEFKGVEQIQRLMEGMTLQDQTTVLEGALAEAAKPIVEASKRKLTTYGTRSAEDAAKWGLGTQIGIRTGALRDSMGFIIRRYKRTAVLIAYIGARHIAYAGDLNKFKAKKITARRPRAEGETRIIPSNYIHLFHNGFFNKLTGKKVPARPFLKDAFDENIAQAEWTLLTGAANALEKVWNRNVANAARAAFKKVA